jgi:hypothetical protein
MESALKSTLGSIRQLMLKQAVMEVWASTMLKWFRHTKGLCKLTDIQTVEHFL